MNLIEAMKSGKRFKRKNNDKWSQCFEPKTGPHTDLVGCGYFVHDGEFSSSINLYYSDLVADDWEIEEEKIELTWKQIENVIANYVTDFNYDLTNAREDLGFKELEKLGFRLKGEE